MWQANNPMGSSRMNGPNTMLTGAPMDSLAPFLEPISVPLSELYLDPNNPRFVGSDWVYVPDAEAVLTPAQDGAKTRLIQHHDVKKLQSSIEANGYLPIDRIVVRQLDAGHYIVLEGNRRVCAAKEINGYSDDGNKLPDDVMMTLEEIPCLLYTGDTAGNEAAWIFQGLRHISGVQDWPAFNKAKLLVDEIERGQHSFTDIGKKFGLSAFGAAQWMRGFYAFRQAKDETEFGRYIDEKLYPYFQEIFGRSSIAFKEWLEWDDNKKRFKNQANLNEFVGWFYPLSRDEEEGDLDIEREPTPAEIQDAWDKRRITKRDDLRQLTYLITRAPREWMEFRSGGDLEKAYSRAVLREMEDRLEADEDAAEKLFKYVEETTKLLESTPFSVLSSATAREKLFTQLDRIKSLSEALRKLGA
jgi:hypothetical protein